MVGLFCATLTVTLQTSFTSYLLADHYGVEDSDAAAILGQIGFVGDLASVSAELFLGHVMDIMGRKWPSVFGLVLSAGAFICSPLPNKLYGLYICRCIGNIGYLPLIYSPF